MANTLNVPVPPMFATLLRLLPSLRFVGIAWDVPSDEPIIYDGQAAVAREPLVLEAWLTHEKVAETIIEAQIGFAETPCKNWLVFDTKANTFTIMEGSEAKQFIDGKKTRVSMDAMVDKVIDRITQKHIPGDRLRTAVSLEKSNQVRAWLDSL